MLTFVCRYLENLNRTKRQRSDDESDKEIVSRRTSNTRRRISENEPAPPIPPRRSAAPTTSKPVTVNLDSDDDEPQTSAATTTSAATATATTAQKPTAEDDGFAAIEARARARMFSNPTAVASPVVNILVTSEMRKNDKEKTKPIIIKRQLIQNLKDVKEYWCNAQGFTPAQAAGMFLVLKRKYRLLDSNTCQGLAITVPEEGKACVDGVIDDKIHFEVMTEEMFKQTVNGNNQDEPEEEEEEPEETLRLTLKTKGKDEYKLKVKPVSRTPLLSKECTNLTSKCILSSITPSTHAFPSSGTVIARP